MAWLILVLAGLFEIAWAVLGKESRGFSRFWPSVGTIVFVLMSMSLLFLAMRELPLGTSYAVWTGIGAIGTVIWGIAFLNEPRDWQRLLCLGLIIAGIVGLRILEPAS